MSTPKKRIDVRGIPEWAYDAAVDWCDANHGTTLGLYLRSVVIQIGREQLNHMVLTGDQVEIARYKKLCNRMGTTAEQRLTNFMRNDLQRHA